MTSRWKSGTSVSVPESLRDLRRRRALLEHPLVFNLLCGGPLQQRRISLPTIQLIPAVAEASPLANGKLLLMSSVFCLSREASRKSQILAVSGQEFGTSPVFLMPQNARGAFIYEGHPAHGFERGTCKLQISCTTAVLCWRRFLFHGPSRADGSRRRDRSAHGGADFFFFRREHSRQGGAGSCSAAGGRRTVWTHPTAASVCQRARPRPIKAKSLGRSASPSRWCRIRPTCSKARPRTQVSG